MRSNSAAHRFDRFRRGDDLAGVAQRVIGHMNHRSADGRGQLLASDEARSIEVGRGQHADSVGGVAEGDFD